MSQLEIPLCRVRPGFDDLELPRYQTEGSAGMDLHAALDMPVSIAAGKRALIPSGIAVAIPEGYEGQVRPRSGLAVKFGVTVMNAPGTIDSDYRGEIQVCLVNHGDAPFEVKRGDRIAQLLIAPVSRAVWAPCETLPETRRSSGGFGHTGT